MRDAKGPSTRVRLLTSGAAVFAEKGYEGGTTREICQRANTSINMVHHYFGTKANLLEAIIEQFGVQVLALPMKLLATPPRSRDDFTENFARFLEEGKHLGFVRHGLDTAMITCAILDRIVSQVLYVPGIEGAYGIDVSDPGYQRRWCTSNVDLYLHGMMPATDP